LANDLQARFQKGGPHCLAFRFDCSDDRLVLQSLSDLLDQTFSGQATDRQALLVADEFHLLNQRQKAELFAWFSPNLAWLRVVLIGNRILRVDKLLMDQLQASQTQFGAGVDGSKRSVVLVKTVTAVLTPSGMMGTCADDNRIDRSSKNYTMLRAWFQVLLLLFGPHALSLRAAFQMCDAVATLPHTAESEAYLDRLRDHLATTMPLLSAVSCCVVAETFLEFDWHGDEPTWSSLWSPNTKSLLYNLVTAAVVAAWGASRSAAMGPAPCFVDFCSTQARQRWRPEDRARAWIQRMSDAFTPGIVNPQNLSTVTYVWVDQDPFPYIVEPHSLPATVVAGDAETGHLAVGISCHFQDLSRLQHLLVHNQPVNWVECESQWRKHPITDLEAFEQLLQDAANKLLCLEAVAGQLQPEDASIDGSVAAAQLCSLAERSAERDRAGIGEIVRAICDVYQLPDALSAGGGGVSSDPQHYAVWRCLLTAGETPEGDDAASGVVRALDEAAVATDLLRDSLLWASEWGASFNCVYLPGKRGGGRAALAAVSRRLTKALRLVTKRMAEEWLATLPDSEAGKAAAATLYNLWSGHFASLLDSTQLAFAARLALAEHEWQRSAPSGRLRGGLHAACLHLICPGESTAEQESSALDCLCGRLRDEGLTSDLHGMVDNSPRRLAELLNSFAAIGKGVKHAANLGAIMLDMRKVATKLHALGLSSHALSPAALEFFRLASYP